MSQYTKLLMIFGVGLLLSGCGDKSEPQEQKQEDASSDEPKVIVCPTGFIGDNCDQCSDDLAGENCDIQNSCANGTPSLGRDGDGHCTDCNSDWAGLDSDIKNSCVNGTANLGLDGTGHCTDCHSDWAGTDCTIANECEHGDANTGLEGDGHCKADSCTNHYAGINCDHCQEDTAETMYDTMCNEYKAVVIDGSTWMAENMSCPTGTYYHANGDEKNDSTYGLLYDWATAMTICPTGWRLPTRQEFLNLIKYVEDNRTSSSNFLALISKTTSWPAYSAKAGDDFGFGALPAGYYDLETYDNFGYYGHFWSSTPDGSDNAYYLYVGGGMVNIYNYKDKTYGYSVRCLKDAD